MKKSLVFPSPKKHCTLDRIALFGSADVDKEHPLYKEVFKVARSLAYYGKTVINGGGPGTMEAATLGAESVDGKTITVSFAPLDMPEFEGQASSNIADLDIKASNYIERMFGLMEQADAFVCFQGGTGTLSEWATAWLLSYLHYGHHKPIVLYGEFWHEVMRVINDSFLIGQKERSIYRIVKNEVETLQVLQQFEEELAERCGLPNR